MKAIYFIVRIIATFFIAIWKAIKFIFNDVYILLREKMLRSKYWEQRILLAMSAIALITIASFSLPVLFAIIFNNSLWLFLSPLTSLIVATISIEVMYHTNREYSASGFSSHHSAIIGEIPHERVEWKSMPKKVAEDDDELDHVLSRPQKVSKTQTTT